MTWSSGISKITFQVDGKTYTTFNQSGTTYTTSVTAPSETSGQNYSSGPGVGGNATNGYYPCRITVEDLAGNSVSYEGTSGDYSNVLRLFVKETVAPTVTVNSPASGVYSATTQTVMWTVTDAGSGVNSADLTNTYAEVFDSTDASIGKVTITSTSGATAAEKVFTGKFTFPKDDTYYIVAHGIDYDGNTGDATRTDITIDTTVSLTVSVDTSQCKQPCAPYQGDTYLTNLDIIKISGTTDDNVTITITDNGAQMYSQTVSKTFEVESLLLSYGENSITVSATDANGNTESTSIIVYMDNVGPSIENISFVTSPTDDTPLGVSTNPVVTSNNWTIKVEMRDPEQ